MTKEEINMIKPFIKKDGRYVVNKKFSDLSEEDQILYYRLQLKQAKEFAAECLANHHSIIEE
jgi:hypothetical protein